MPPQRRAAKPRELCQNVDDASTTWEAVTVRQRALAAGRVGITAAVPFRVRVVGMLIVAGSLLLSGIAGAGTQGPSG